MLNPNTDRLDFGRLLSPPAGYTVEFAVGTTFSLDLDALVGAAFALGLGVETDSSLLNDRVFLLEALRRTSDKAVLFCQDGQIYLPGKPTPLLILLENMVFPIRLRKNSGSAASLSFHPKFWLIHYSGEHEDDIYRFLILSRNLTFDRSWDAAWQMDGRRKKKKNPRSEPLSDFLLFLQSNIPSDTVGRKKARALRDIAEDISYTHFHLDEPFHNYAFLPSGIPQRGSFRPSFLGEDTFTLFTDSASCDELAVISPFLSKGVVREFNRRAPDVAGNGVLLTRTASLAGLKAKDVNRLDVYTMRDEILDGEDCLQEEGVSPQKQDLHAKVYFARKGKRSELYIGSANASHNALYGNVELMLRLQCDGDKLNLGKLKEELWDEENEIHPFRKVLPEEFPQDEEENSSGQLEKILRAVCEMGITAEAAQERMRQDYYTIIIKVPKKGEESKKPEPDVSIRPLLYKGTEQPLNETICFEGLRLTELSEFYAVCVKAGQEILWRVLRIPTKGLPSHREDAIVSDTVQDQEIFYRYAFFLLGEDVLLSALETGTVSRLGTNLKTVPPALYEQMLQAAADYPERLENLGWLVKHIPEGNNVLKDFAELYDTFRKAVGEHGTRKKRT